MNIIGGVSIPIPSAPSEPEIKSIGSKSAKIMVPLKVPSPPPQTVVKGKSPPKPSIINVSFQIVNPPLPTGSPIAFPFSPPNSGNQLQVPITPDTASGSSTGSSPSSSSPPLNSQSSSAGISRRISPLEIPGSTAPRNSLEGRHLRIGGSGSGSNSSSRRSPKNATTFGKSPNITAKATEQAFNFSWVESSDKYRVAGKQNVSPSTQYRMIVLSKAPVLNLSGNSAVGISQFAEGKIALANQVTAEVWFQGLTPKKSTP